MYICLQLYMYQVFILNDMHAHYPACNTSVCLCVHGLHFMHMHGISAAYKQSSMYGKILIEILSNEYKYSIMHVYSYKLCMSKVGVPYLVLHGK